MLPGWQDYWRNMVGPMRVLDGYVNHLDRDFHMIGGRMVPAVTTTATAVSVMTAFPEPPPSFLKVVITEDRSDSLVVPEARVRPGFLDPHNRFLDRAYQADNSPKKIYYAANAGREIDSPVEGAVVISQGECHVVIRSRIAHADAGKPVKTWAVLCRYGVNTAQPAAVLVRQEGTDDIVTQVFRVTYTNNSEFGCLTLRCTNESLTYNKELYRQNDLLTIYFHRTKEDFDAAPYPPVITMTKLADQNYVPMVPGQILQIIPNLGPVEVEEYQSQGDKCLLFLDKEQLTKNGKLWVYRYECIRVAEMHQPLFLKGEQSCSVIVPPVLCDDKDVFAVITEPYKSVKVWCDNILSLRVRFAKDIPVVRWPSKIMWIPSANTQMHELKLNFHKRLSTVILANENGTCSIVCTLPGLGTYTPPAKK